MLTKGKKKGKKSTKKKTVKKDIEIAEYRRYIKKLKERAKHEMGIVISRIEWEISEK
jgi:hypothetical protein